MELQSQQENCTEGTDECRVFLPQTEQKKVEDVRLKHFLPQIFAGLIAQCIVIRVGVNMAYTTIFTRGLIDEGKIRITENEVSWIASLIPISLPIGSLLVGPLMDRFGRRTICMVSCVPSLISWILIIFANSLGIIYSARIVAGISSGLTTVGLVYVSEVTHPRVRSTMLCVNSVYVSFGVLLACGMAMILDWWTMAIGFLVLDFCVLLQLTILPESPYWLACFRNNPPDNQRVHQLERSLKWLNRNQRVYEEESSRIRKTQLSRSITDEPKNFWETLKIYRRELCSRKVHRPLTILFFLFLLQQLSGAYVIVFYALSIFREIGNAFGESLSEDNALVGLGAIRFVTSVITAFLSQKYGRRAFCMFSGIGMTITALGAGLSIYMGLHLKSNVLNYQWITMIFLLLYMCTSSAGFAVIPWTMISELLPISFRGVGGGLVVAIAYILMSCTLKLYPYAVNLMSIQGVLYFFSVSSALCTAFVYFFLPETLGKSLVEIESYFSRGRTKP